MAALRRLAGGILAVIVAALATAGTGTDAQADAWWEPTALTTPALAVTVAAGAVVVQTTDGRVLESRDAGASWSPAPAGTSAAALPAVYSAGTLWEIRDGRVMRGSSPSSLAPDSGAPDLGAAAYLVAAPASLPGVVVAAAADGTIWRRGMDGGWGRALILLPPGLIGHPPAITGLAAFDQPLSDAVYLSTAGYSVLLSSDGGDDWIRAGPGLPDDVEGLAADPGGRALFAATPAGVFVHRLQSFPAPPAYADSDLWLRWLGIVAVSLAAAAAAGAALWLVERRANSIATEM